MDWASAEIKGDHTIVVPERWLHLHYYEAFNILFRAENALRVFVYVILKNALKDKWASAALQPSDDTQSTIAATASKRMQLAKGFGYLGYSTNSPLMYLNSGELTRMITSNAYWKLFEPHFRGKKEIIKNKLDEINTIRNSLAHFRPIKPDDIEVIKQNVKHTYLGIEQCFMSLLHTNRVTPTNTETEWYNNLMTLGSKLCSLKLHQDATNQWIRMEIEYCSAILRDSGPGDYRNFTVSNLTSPAVIKIFPILASHCIFVTERARRPTVRQDNNPTIKKSLSFTFSFDTIDKAYKEIEGQIKALLVQVETETELVQNDNLARGALIDVARVRSRRRDDDSFRSFETDVDAMKSGIDENSPAEYWADLTLNLDDFIAGTTKYPWMPAEISKDEFPF